MYDFIKPSLVADYSGKIYKKVFLNLLPANIIYGWILCAGGIVDSLFTSHFLGAEGVAAIGFFSPIVVFLWLIINTFTNGAGVFIGKNIGKGDTSSANKIFSFCFVFLIIFGAVLAFIFLILGKKTTTLLGASAETFSLTTEYTFGYIIGFPALFISGYLTSLISYDYSQKLTSLMTSLIYTVSDIILDYVFLMYCNLGMFGLALATSISYYLADLYLICRIISKKSVLAFNFKKISFRYLSQIVSTGLPAASIEIYIVIRMFAYNSILFKRGGVLAVSAYAIACSIESFMNSIVNGVANSTLNVGSVIIGEDDRESLHIFARVVYIYGFLFVGMCSFVLFMLSPIVCVPFSGNNPTALSESIVAVKFLAISFVFGVTYTTNLRFYQALELNKTVSIFYIFSNLVFPVGSALILSYFFGVRGIWITLVVTNVLSLMMIYVYAWIKSKKLFFTIIDFITLGKNVGVSGSDSLNVVVRDENDVKHLNQEIVAFCNRESSNVQSNVITPIIIEEILSNIIKHGFKIDNKGHIILFRMIKKDNQIITTIKDDCKSFEKKLLKNLHKNENENQSKQNFNYIEHIKYKKLFGMNVITMKMEA